MGLVQKEPTVRNLVRKSRDLAEKAQKESLVAIASEKYQDPDRTDRAWAKVTAYREKSHRALSAADQLKRGTWKVGEPFKPKEISQDGYDMFFGSKSK